MLFLLILHGSPSEGRQISFILFNGDLIFHSMNRMQTSHFPVSRIKMLSLPPPTLHHHNEYHAPFTENWKLGPRWAEL